MRLLLETFERQKDVIAPTLNAKPRSLDLWTERLVMYALAMVQAEARRRKAAARAKGKRKQ